MDTSAFTTTNAIGPKGLSDSDDRRGLREFWFKVANPPTYIPINGSRDESYAFGQPPSFPTVNFGGRTLGSNVHMPFRFASSPSIWLTADAAHADAPPSYFPFTFSCNERGIDPKVIMPPPPVVPAQDAIMLFDESSYAVRSADQPHVDLSLSNTPNLVPSTNVSAFTPFQAAGRSCSPLSSVSDGLWSVPSLPVSTRCTSPEDSESDRDDDDEYTPARVGLVERRTAGLKRSTTTTRCAQAEGNTKRPRLVPVAPASRPRSPSISSVPSTSSNNHAVSASSDNTIPCKYSSEETGICKHRCREGDMRRHVLTHLPPDSGFFCPKCQKKFNRCDALKRHFVRPATASCRHEARKISGQWEDNLTELFYRGVSLDEFVKSLMDE